jgi:Uma2 family endonuclease
MPPSPLLFLDAAMSTQLPPVTDFELEYPDSDAQPMGENNLQYDWIVTITANVDGMYPRNAEIFVAGDLFWYPVQGHPEIRTAPDVLVAFGRPKGYRPSYRQWLEGGVAPQVVFEIRSPGNTDLEMDEKLVFYDRYGVEEYYMYDPFVRDLRGWRRIGDHLQAIGEMNGWVSPRLGIRFDMSGEELLLFDPAGKLFEVPPEIRRKREQAELRAEQAEHRAEQAQQRAEQAGQRAKQAEQRAEQERRRADWLVDQLRALGVEPTAPPRNGNGGV